MNPIPHSLPEPYASANVITYLIREELKSRKFFEGLRDLGLDDAFYQVDLLDLIMAGLGLEPESQDDYNFCHTALRKHSIRVVEDRDELLNEAKRVYRILAKYGEKVHGQRSTVHGNTG
jgi:hypothetical protein